jgi:predicted nucleic acid-binding protein
MRAACAEVPLVWHEEVAGVLLRRLRAGRIDRDTFDRAARGYNTLPLVTHVNPYYVNMLIERAERFSLAALDAMYLDLALTRGLPIATLDGGLRTAAKSHGIKLFEPAAA